MYMKPNKVGKNMWLPAQIAYQNLKQNAQTQDADGMQIFYTLYLTEVEANISKRILRIGGSEPQTPTFPLRLPPRDKHHFEIKTV